MEKNLLLKHISNYINLSPKENEILLSKVNFRKYLKGQYVVQEGDICKYHNFVLAGCLKSFYMDPEGNEHIISFAIENWWTGNLESFVRQEPSNYNVQCMEICELAQFSYKNLEILYQEIPKLERFFRIKLQNAYISYQKRVFENISLPARERYLNFRKRYSQIESRVPQYMIASYLGITAEFLSKIKKELQKENIS
ncbi:Crp/Fnr family transcriptional regulator [Xanthovirga aplysinae]|uniref:Crp/Fnr family transcriptional regulator n=1 Tax=Xanthovirga aplysinae TaxID=2529853 RepID=UPI0012BD7A77|nr:Crp/Fnr family transcriptional regulator [Xanthovirga aplysinae]MTI32749.1 Crp/Fnr family transcriptional regulator [Xanthovirga aplysinae]